MLKLTKRIDVSTPELYYDEKFKVLVEQHLTDLKNYKGNTYLTVTPMEMDMWEGNLYGYLVSQRVPVFQHWIIMRMNGMDSTLDFRGDVATLKLPDVENINRLRELHNTIHRN